MLDPHGDLVDRVLGIIPPERIADVVLIDPSDEDHSVGFNILAANSDFEKKLARVRFGQRVPATLHELGRPDEQRPAQCDPRVSGKLGGRHARRSSPLSA